MSTFNKIQEVLFNVSTFLPSHVEDEALGWRDRLRICLRPLILIQILGLFQALSVMADIGMINNAIQRPVLQYLLQCFFLLVFGNVFLFWSYGRKNFWFVYEARSWLYLLFAMLDFLAYKLDTVGQLLMPRAYNTALPGLTTLLLISFTVLLLTNRYTRYQAFSIALGLAGLAFTVWGDQAIDLNFFTNIQDSIAAGIVFTLLGCLFKALAYLTMEATLHRFNILEFISLFGLFGMVISFLEMAFVDSYEFAPASWENTTAGYLVLSGFLRSLSLVLIALLTQRYTSTFTTLAVFTGGAWYCSLSNLGFQRVPAFQPQFQHVVAYLLVLLAQVAYLFAPVYMAKDRTYLLDFHRRY